MAKARISPEAWVEEGLQVLAKGGPDAVRVEPLARSLGITKGSFYWSFKDRAALLEAILDRWERASVDEVIERIEARGGEPAVKLRHLFALARGRDGIDLGRVDLAIRDWARRDEAVAARLQRVDDRRIDYMRSLFAATGAGELETEARCLLVFSLFVGTPFIGASHPGHSRAEVLEEALDQLVG
ncbi:MAG TPA: TetR/AcrR family transcriptional regulator [Solirubrobacterales bacterium]|jgi:AcrR family transcriptional regulator